jgi:hypothetical protein
LGRRRDWLARFIFYITSREMKMRCAHANEERVEIAVEGGGKITVRALAWSI